MKWASPVVPLEGGALSAPKLQAQRVVEGDRGACAAEVGWHRDNPSRGRGHQSRVSSPFALFVHEAFQRVCGTPAFNSCAIQAIVWTRQYRLCDGIRARGFAVDGKLLELRDVLFEEPSVKRVFDGGQRD